MIILPPPVIVRGEDKSLILRLISKTTEEPIDLTLADEIESIFLNEDGTCQHYNTTMGNLVVVSAAAGKCRVDLPASGTALLAPNNFDGSYQGMETHVVISGKTTIVNQPNSLDIQSRLFPDC